MVFLVWSTTVAEYYERHEQHGHEGEIRYSLMAMYEQRCKQEIMYEKQQQIDREMSPYDEHLSPVELDARVAYRPHIQTQQWSGKKPSPHRQVYDIFQSRLLHTL